MKLKHIKNTLFNTCFLIAASLICNCSGNTRQEEKSQLSASSPQAITTADAQAKYYINGKGNISLAEIIQEGEKIIIHTGKETLFGAIKRVDKRKYYDENDQFRYSVKYKDEGDFKLRDKNEELLWKVKIGDDKIKIADNEEMTDAYDINFYEEGRIKLKKNEKEIKSIRFEPGGTNVEVPGNYYLRNFTNSFAPGVLMIPDMKETDKFIICAELVKLGK